MDGNFKFQVQDSDLEQFILEIWIFEKRIALSEKKPFLRSYCPNLYILVAAKKYDLFLAGNSLTESRAKIVDHSFPIILTSVRMIYLRHSESASDSSTWVYTQSFLVISWIVIASMTLLTFVIYFFLQRLANKVHMIFFSY